MPTAEARLATDRASRYLVQLCRHLGQMSRMGHRTPTGRGSGHTPPSVQHVDYSDTHATVDFADGRWTLEATPDTLVLRVDADDESALQRLQAGIVTRIAKIGRRDALEVHWERVEPDAEADARPRAAQDLDTPGTSGTRHQGLHAHHPGLAVLLGRVSPWHRRKPGAQAGVDADAAR